MKNLHSSNADPTAASSGNTSSMGLARPSIPHLGYRRDIDGLRALAVTAVVMFHAAPKALPGGFVGVDIFFVISGFLITSILTAEIEAGSFSIARFYARRVQRIFPALALVLFFSLGAGWLFLLTDEYAELGKHVAGGAGFVSNLLLWSEADYFDTASAAKPLLHLWSLGIEEQFYILWPIMLWCAYSLGMRRMALIGSVIAVSFAASVFVLPINATAAFYSPLTRFWELAVGAGLALYPNAAKHIATSKALREGVSFAGLALCAVAIFVLSEAVPFPGWRALLPVAGAACLIAAGPGATVNRLFLASSPAVWVGLISYPLYLWHWPLLSFAHIATSGVTPLWLRVWLCVAAVILAWLTYRYVEIPVRRRSAAAWRVFALTGFVAALGVFGGTVLLLDGVSSRRVISLSDWSAPTTQAGDLSLELGLYAQRLLANPRYLETIDAERNAAIRWPSCHFSKYDQTFAKFEPGMEGCLARDAQKNNVLVIGDSHGGDFYAVLARTHSNINVLQATGASCAPISSRYRGQADPCGMLVERAFAFAETHKLYAVVLAGLWYTDYIMLAPDIRRLKAAGQTVIVVGQPMLFTADVPRIIERRTSDFGFDHYLMRYLLSDQDGFNEGVREVATREGAMFLDRKAYQCSPKCAIFNENGELLIRDYGHLTAAGAAHLGERILNERVIERLVAGDAWAGQP